MHTSSCHITVHPAVDEVEGPDLLTVPGRKPGGGGNNGAVAEARVNRYLGLRHMPEAVSICGERDLPVFNQLQLFGVRTSFITVPGDTRVNRIVRGHDGSEQMHYGAKMLIEAPAIERLFNRIANLPYRARVAISGSLPQGMTPQFTLDLLAMLIEWKQCRVLIDGDADIVGAVLRSQYRDRIVTIKQNDTEFANLTGEELSYKVDGRKIFNLDQLMRLTDHQLPHGEFVVTLGKQGILLRLGDRAWRIKGQLPAGVKEWTSNRCGDSYVGGNLSAKTAGASRILGKLGPSRNLTRMGLPADFPSDPAAPTVLAAMLGVAAATANTSCMEPGFDLDLLDEIFRGHLSIEEVTARATVSS